MKKLILYTLAILLVAFNASGDVWINGVKTTVGSNIVDPTITGGTIDGTVIGGTTAAAGTFTTLQANTILQPDASGGADIGSTSLEWGDTYIGDRRLYIGADQDLVFGHNNSFGESRIYSDDNSILYIKGSNWSKNFDVAASQTNPTLFIFSAKNPDTDNTEWLSFAHDQTNAVFGLGSGAYTFPDGNVCIGCASPEYKVEARDEKNGLAATIAVTNTYTAASSVDEVSDFALRFNQDTTAKDAVRLRAVKESDWTSASNADSAFAVQTTLNGNTTERLRIDSAGNMGQGVVPESTWAAAFSAYQLGGNAAFMGQTTAAADNSLNIMQNLYYDGAYKAISGTGTAATSRINMGSSGIIFNVASDGDATVTPTEILALTIENDGDVVVGGAMVQRNSDDSTHGGYQSKVYSATSGTLTGATDKIELDIPSGWRIEQCQLHVKTAVTNAGDNTWSAELNDGAQVEAISAGSSAAQNTNVNHWADADTWGTLTDAETDILLTPQGADFTAGEIEAHCIAKGFDTWDNE